MNKKTNQEELLHGVGKDSVLLHKIICHFYGYIMVRAIYLKTVLQLIIYKIAYKSKQFWFSYSCIMFDLTLLM